MKKTAIIFGALFTVFSCNNPTQKEQKLSTEDFSLVGKSVSLSYPDFKADISYSSDSILHWRTIQPDGNAENGDEKMNMKKIADSLFFVNWIEKDGTSISQILDFETKSVTVFCTFADEENPRGKRSNIFFEGTIDEVKSSK